MIHEKKKTTHKVGILFTRFMKTPQKYDILRGRESVVRALWMSLSYCRIILKKVNICLDNKNRR